MHGGVWTIGDATVDAVAGDIIVVPAGLPHTFANAGDEPLRQTAFHAAATIAIEWLDGR